MVTAVAQDGDVNMLYTNTSSGWSGTRGVGLRPALRLNLDDLLLSAKSDDQSQVLSDSDSLRLTFVDLAAGMLEEPSVVLSGDGRTLMFGGSASDDGFVSDGFGWKLVDPNAADGSVVASGFDADGVVSNFVYGSQVADGEYDLYYWAQENGSAADGWSNRATEPVLARLCATPLALDGLNESYTYGDASSTLTATGGCGAGAVTYASSGPGVASVDASTGVLSIHGVGDFTISVSKASDGSYPVASYTSGVVRVLPRAVTVAADSKEITQGADVGDLSYAVSPALVGDDVLSGRLCATGAGDVLVVGEYPIVRCGEWVNPNYLVSFVPGTLRVVATPKLGPSPDSSPAVVPGGVAVPAQSLSNTGGALGVLVVVTLWCSVVGVGIVVVSRACKRNDR